MSLSWGHQLLWSNVSGEIVTLRLLDKSIISHHQLLDTCYVTWCRHRWRTLSSKICMISCLTDCGQWGKIWWYSLHLMMCSSTFWQPVLGERYLLQFRYYPHLVILQISSYIWTFTVTAFYLLSAFKQSTPVGVFEVMSSDRRNVSGIFTKSPRGQWYGDDAVSLPLDQSWLSSCFTLGCEYSKKDGEIR